MPLQSSTIVELIGPAGAGKSTLLRALQSQKSGLTHIEFFADRLPAREARNLPFYLTSGLLTLPMLVRLWGQRTTLCREELSRILYLQGMPRYFTSQYSAASRVVVDQGPIFELTHLQAFGATALHMPAMKQWWEQQYARWAHHLALVIWLDAPDAVLIPRIQTREQAHIVKTLTEPAATAVLARYRQSFTNVMSALQHYASIPVLHIRTDEMPATAVAAQVLAAIEAEHIEAEHIDNNIPAAGSVDRPPARQMDPTVQSPLHFGS